MRRLAPVVALLVVALAVVVVLLLKSGSAPPPVVAEQAPASLPPAAAPAPPPVAAKPALVAAAVDAGARADGGARAFAPGQVVVRGAWGSKPGQFGRRREQEANPEAPMAVSAGAGGEIAIVDQVNRRVQRFDKSGKLLGTLETGGDTVQDIAPLTGHRTALLDRLADRNLQIYDEAGKLANEVTLVGPGVPEGGAVTGVFSDDSGVYVERGHEAVIRIADGSGRSLTDRQELPGRPTRDGRQLVAAALAGDPQAGLVAVRAFDRQTQQVRWERQLPAGAPILHLVMLDSDRAGRIYVAAATGTESPAPPYRIVDEAIRVLRLSPDGSPTGAITIPPIDTPDEQFRPLSVDDDGNVYAMVPGEGGLTVTRYAF